MSTDTPPHQPNTLGGICLVLGVLGAVGQALKFVILRRQICAIGE
jgi:hypothetical protein